NEHLSIGAFVMFGDTELTESCARELLDRAPAFDVLITAESKGIPLVCSMARLSGKGRYVLARKSVKLYMKDVVSFAVKSITTTPDQTLYLDGGDVAYLKGKKVLIVDDVISTGRSLEALENLVTTSGGEIAGRMAVLAEGDAIGRPDIVTLADLPLFHPDGTPL
ncbi:MAG: adenine phosphoribosyltransferase, partial [Clostridia bacterium]|nr:adenine phosphoribosyltransferase [Clostridia bacterium]